MFYSGSSSHTLDSYDDNFEDPSHYISWTMYFVLWKNTQKASILTEISNIKTEVDSL